MCSHTGHRRAHTSPTPESARRVISSPTLRPPVPPSLRPFDKCHNVAPAKHEVYQTNPLVTAALQSKPQTDRPVGDGWRIPAPVQSPPIQHTTEPSRETPHQPACEHTGQGLRAVAGTHSAELIARSPSTLPSGHAAGNRRWSRPTTRHDSIGRYGRVGMDSGAFLSRATPKDAVARFPAAQRPPSRNAPAVPMR